MSRDELVDVIDENNHIIDTVPRYKMKEQHLPHRACYIGFCDRQGKFLVEIRTLSKDYSPGTFDAVVGGVMQHGEDPIESAKRELFEEIGVDANWPKVNFYPLDTLKIQKGEHFLYAYLYLAVADAITVRQESEVSGIMYVPYSEIVRLQDSCNFDSVTALTEIIKRAKDRKLI